MDPHFLKIPQSENVYQSFSHAIRSVYGQQIALATDPLIKLFAESRDSVKVLVFGVPDDSQQLEKQLYDHICLTSVLEERLEFQPSHNRFLNLSFKWLDTFQQQMVAQSSLRFQKISVIYNAVLLAISTASESLRRRKHTQVKFRIKKAYALLKELKNYLPAHAAGFGCRDLNEANLEIQLQVLQGLYLYNEIKLRQETGTKHPLDQRAAAYYHASKIFKQVFQSLNKYSDRISGWLGSFYEKTIYFLRACAQMEFCTKMIRYLELWVKENPTVFQDIMGYNARLLQVLRLEPEDYQKIKSFQITQIEAWRNEAMKVQEGLHLRNVNIYNMRATPTEMLPQPQSQICASISIQNFDFKADLTKLKEKYRQQLGRFWPREIDDMVARIDKRVNSTIDTIQNSMVSLEEQIIKAQKQSNVSPKEYLEQSLIFSKLMKSIKLEYDKIFRIAPAMLINQYQSCISRLNKITERVQNSKVRNWCLESQKAVQEAKMININLRQKLQSQKKYFLKMETKERQKLYQPSYPDMLRKYQLMRDRLLKLEQLKYKPYLKMLLEAQDSHLSEQTIHQGLDNLAREWIQQIQSLKKTITEFNKYVENQKINEEVGEYSSFIVILEDIKRTRDKQLQGLSFFKRLKLQIEKVEVALNK